MFYTIGNNRFSRNTYEIHIDSLNHILIHDSGQKIFLVEIIEKRIIRKDKLYGTKISQGELVDVINDAVDFAYTCLNIDSNYTISEINWHRFKNRVKEIAQNIN